MMPYYILISTTLLLIICWIEKCFFHMEANFTFFFFFLNSNFSTWALIITWPHVPISAWRKYELLDFYNICTLYEYPCLDVIWIDIPLWTRKRHTENKCHRTLFLLSIWYPVIPGKIRFCALTNCILGSNDPVSGKIPHFPQPMAWWTTAIQFCQLSSSHSVYVCGLYYVIWMWFPTLAAASSFLPPLGSLALYIF